MDLKVNSYCNNSQSFQGSIHKSVDKIFNDLRIDLGNKSGQIRELESDAVTVDGVFNKLSEYVKKTSDDIELYWREPSLLKKLFSRDTYTGLTFRNKVTKQEVQASRYPNTYFADYVVHDSVKYVDTKGITAQAPKINPAEREVLTGSKSKFLDDLHAYYGEYSYLCPGCWKKRAPVAEFFVGVLRMMISLVPKVKKYPYSQFELKELGRWTDELCAHTEPSDVDKLLKIVK